MYNDKNSYRKNVTDALNILYYHSIIPFQIQTHY